MSNSLPAHFSHLGLARQKACDYLRSDPRAAGFYLRFGLERMLEWMYRFDHSLVPPLDNEVFELLRTTQIKLIMPQDLLDGADEIRRVGNRAVHQLPPPRIVEISDGILHFQAICSWLAERYPEPLPDSSLRQARSPIEIPARLEQLVAESLNTEPWTSWFSLEGRGDNSSFDSVRLAPGCFFAVPGAERRLKLDFECTVAVKLSQLGTFGEIRADPELQKFLGPDDPEAGDQDEFQCSSAFEDRFRVLALWSRQPEKLEITDVFQVKN